MNENRYGDQRAEAAWALLTTPMHMPRLLWLNTQVHQHVETPSNLNTVRLTLPVAEATLVQSTRTQTSLKII